MLSQRSLTHGDGRMRRFAEDGVQVDKVESYREVLVDMRIAFQVAYGDIEDGSHMLPVLGGVLLQWPIDDQSYGVEAVQSLRRCRAHVLNDGVLLYKIIGELHHWLRGIFP